MPSRPMEIRSDSAPLPIGPYSQAIAYGGLIFVSGQVGIDSSTGTMVDGGAGPQARQALRNVSAILSAAGAHIDDIVKVSLYLENLSDFGEVNEVYAEFFGACRPARTTVGGTRLPKGALLEIDVVAALVGP